MRMDILIKPEVVGGIAGMEKLSHDAMYIGYSVEKDRMIDSGEQEKIANLIKAIGGKILSKVAPLFKAAPKAATGAATKMPRILKPGQVARFTDKEAIKFSGLTPKVKAVSVQGSGGKIGLRVTSGTPKRGLKALRRPTVPKAPPVGQFMNAGASEAVPGVAKKTFKGIGTGLGLGLTGGFILSGGLSAGQGSAPQQQYYQG